MWKSDESQPGSAVDPSLDGLLEMRIEVHEQREQLAVFVDDARQGRERLGQLTLRPRETAGVRIEFIAERRIAGLLLFDLRLKVHAQLVIGAIDSRVVDVDLEPVAQLVAEDVADHVVDASSKVSGLSGAFAAR